MSPPPALDFLDLDRLLSEEERLIRDTTRGFVADRILPEVAGWFERGELPRELAKELGDLGLLGMHLEGYGCAGTNAVSYGLACLELEAGDSGARSFVSVQGSLAMYPIWRTAPRSRSSAGCRPWPPARRSAASA
jgi:glutaryl-CoA dehydrogenase